MNWVTGRFGPIPVRTPGPFGPIPFRTGRYGLGRSGPISRVGWVVGWCDGSEKSSSAGASYSLNIVGQGPTALAVGAGRVVWTFLLSSILSLLCLPLFGRRPDID